MEEPKKEIQISAQPEQLRGSYASNFLITSQEREVVIDFLSRMRNDHHLVSRIVLNHSTARELSDLLRQNLEQWQKLRYEGKEGKQISE